MGCLTSKTEETKVSRRRSTRAATTTAAQPMSVTWKPEEDHFACPSLASDGVTVHAAVRGNDQRIYYRRQQQGHWSAWVALDVVAASGPAIVSWGPGRVDIFVRSAFGTLLHCYNEADRWTSWSDLGGELLHAPAVCSRAVNQLDVFITTSTKLRSVLTKRYDSLKNSWSEWCDLGGQPAYSCAAVSVAPHRVDLFMCGKDLQLYHRWWDNKQQHQDDKKKVGKNNGWQPAEWQEVTSNVPLSCSPSACILGSGRIEIFCKNQEKNCLRRTMELTATSSTNATVVWSEWESLGGEHFSSIAATSTSHNELFLMSAKKDSTPQVKCWTNAHWTEWQPIDGSMY